MNKNKLALLTLSMLAVSGNTLAAPTGLVTDWGYLNEAGFNSWTTTLADDSGVTATNDVNSLFVDQTFTTLSWGQPTFLDSANPTFTNGQSQLLVDSPINGSVVTNGAEVIGTDLIHNNYVVGSSNGNLTSASLLDALMLMPTAIDGTPVSGLSINAPLITFAIDFFETTNFVDYGFSPFPNATGSLAPDTSVTCANGEQNGSGIHIRGCADIFVVSTETPGVDFSINDDGDLLFTNTFNFGDDAVLGAYNYSLTTRLSGINLINDAACSAVGVGAGCFGFLTVEEEANVLEVSYKITASLIPEPATLAVFGLGLLATGAIRRKTKK